MVKKSLPELGPDDIALYPLWRFTNAGVDELEVESLDRAPKGCLAGVVVGSPVVMNDGTRVWSLVQNVSRAGEAVNGHFLTITVWHDDEWFSLARYHDVTIETHGPAELAEFLGKSVTDVFPIAYDLRAALGSSSIALTGAILPSPVFRLSRDEIIRFALIRSRSVICEAMEKDGT